MRFGICARVEAAADIQAAGADYIEENVQSLLQGKVEDAQWTGMERVRGVSLPIPAANSLVPGDIKIVGPAVDMEQLRAYMTRAMARAGQVGIKTVVFGSGGARNVPEGFDRGQARRQILEFLAMSAPLAAQNGITLVAEPLRKQETNIINSVDEAMGYVKQLNHPNFQCLVDSYHFWVENDSLEDLAAAMPWIQHVHVADKDGRVAPGESGTADYRPFFSVIKKGKYDSMISVEAIGFKDYKNVAPRVLSFLRRQWHEA
jgi:sugar phosphate isomerase/epimerase